VRRADDGHAFSVPVHQRCVKAQYMIAHVDNATYRRIFHRGDGMTNGGNRPQHNALTRRSRLDNYFIFRPTRGKALY
jgi:hypothetical protein